MSRKINCVLLVDDDEATNFINRIVLEKSAVTDQIQSVLNGKEAIEYLTNTGKYHKEGNVFPQPMLILLDINMPVMDGWEFLDEYQKLQENQKCHTIIVMVTTSFNPDDQTRAEKINGLSGYRNKPLTVELMHEIMRTHFAEYI